MRMTEAERIIKATIILNREAPFFASILLNFEIRETQPSTEVPTIGVTKYGKLFWNEEFVSKLSNEELRYVLCHEVLHIAKGDLFRIGYRDFMIWNIVTDCIINDILNVEGFTPPKKMSFIDKDGNKKEEDCGYIPNSNGDVKISRKTYNVRNKSSEEFYDELIRDIDKISQTINISVSADGTPQSGDGTGGNTQDHGGFDVHIQGNSNDKGEKDGEDSAGSSADEAASEAKWKQIAVQAATIAHQRGKIPGCVDGLIEGLLNPVIDWRSRLRSFITNEIPVDFDTRLPGRAFYSTRVWCPKVHRENMELYVSIDCSGSTMNDRETFVGEIQGICESHTQLNAHLIFWSYGEIDENNDIEINSQSLDKLKQINLQDINGGTELSSYTRYLEKQGMNSRLHIVLTDGYIESKPDVPDGTILFVLCGDCTDDIVKDYGEVVYIRDQTPEWDN